MTKYGRWVDAGFECQTAGFREEALVASQERSLDLELRMRWNADARVVALRNQPEIEIASEAAGGRRIQHAFDLLRNCPLRAP